MSDTRSPRDASLDRPLVRSLRVTVDEAAVQRMWSGIERRLPRERAPRAARGLWLAFGSLLVAAVVGFGALKLAPAGHGVEPRPLLLADGRAFESIENGVAHFADGSRIEAEPGARVESLASTPAELALLVRTGKARFFVTPGGPRRWSIDARGVRVEVVGTVLSVEASERAVRVAVDVGVVLVRSPLLPDGVRRLSAGQDVELALERAVPKLVEPAPSELPVAEPIVSEPSVQPAPSPPARTSRSRAARRSPPAAAAPSSPRNDAARDLWARADAARAASQPELAIQLLEQLLREHPADAQAPLGAFTLGTVLAEQHEAERARQAFRRALELGLPSVLRELCQRRLQELESEQVPRGGAGVPR